MGSASLDDRGVLIECPSCGQRTRLPYGALEKHARCGHCKTDVLSPAAPIEAASSAAFTAAAELSALPVVVDFWAPWCGPCRMVAPELEKVARSGAGRWLVVKVNTDVLDDVAARYRIQSIPTLAVIRNGRELGRITGARPAADIERFIVETAGLVHG
jgi:thioredoxin 2